MVSFNEALEKSVEYFDGDELAANVFVTKYALRDRSGNFYEETPRKEGQESFIDSFRDTLYSIRDNGFKKGGTIPILRGSPLNGAHRIASCIALDTPLQTREGHASEGQYMCNYEYFRDKKDFVSEGLEQIYLDEMALEYCRNKNNLFTITLFP